MLWELEQRRLVEECLLDYCLHVDRNDPEALVEQVFAPDAAFELGSRHAVVGRDDLAKMFAKTLAAFTATSHHLSNVRITLEGRDRATATAYVYAWHRTVAGERVEVWGRYADELVLGAAGWRISRRCLAMAGTDGWVEAPFEAVDRQPNPLDPPSPKFQRR